MLSNNLFFFAKAVLFIIGPTGFNFTILKLKIIFYEKLGKRENLTLSSNSFRETCSNSAQFNVICENPIRSDWWNSVISSVYAFSRDEPSLSPTIQHSCFTPLVVEHFLTHWLQASILLGRNWWCGYCDKLSETLKTWKANSHLPSHCPSYLRANGQHFQVPNCPHLNYRIRKRFPGFLSWNISEDIRNTPSQRQSFRNPAGTWLARFVSWCVCHLLSWN